jgi:tripartite-type tricarboxylate transporter receptor subunit TctC
MIRAWRAAAAALAAALAVPAAAADFYAGKTISLYVGFGAGGGYDTYGRFAGRGLGKHIPGNPTVVVQNMPGAGGLKVASFMAGPAPKDGTALAVAVETLALDQALGAPGVEFDARRFNWVGRMTDSTNLFFTWHTSPTKTFADATRRETLCGSSGSGTTTDAPKVLNLYAGAKFKLILGYRGSTEVLLAMERGEVECGYALWSDFKARRPDWITGKKVNNLYIMATGRQPDLPGVPAAAELVTSDEGKQIVDLFSSGSDIGRSVFTTPDVPADRVEILRRAFTAMIADPAFLAEAQQAKLHLNPLDGATLQAQVARSMSHPPELIAKAKEVRK